MCISIYYIPIKQIFIVLAHHKSALNKTNSLKISRLILHCKFFTMYFNFQILLEIFFTSALTQVDNE